MTRIDAQPSGQTVYPAALRERNWWANWVLALPFDGGDVDWDAKPTKQPVAPYDTGHARPVRWHAGLSDEDHPTTEFENVQSWEGISTERDIESHERVLSDELGVGIIIPVGGGDGQTITLLDWDDVRDPETGEIHPVCAEALEQLGAFAEISQSGEGIHQFVFGEIPGGFSKFLRFVDDEPFVGDDRPMIEMYSSGRVVALTGRHVEGCGEDVVEGQDLIDHLCWRFGLSDNNAEGEATDPYGRRRDISEELDETPEHDDVGDSLREAIKYDGDDPEEWDIPDSEPLTYHAVLRAREQSDELPTVANWELIGYAAAFAYEHDIGKEQLFNDLKEHPTPSYGFDKSRAKKEVRGVFRKAEAGNYQPPSVNTLVERGILPRRFLTDTEDDTRLSPTWTTVDYYFTEGEQGAAMDAAADALEEELSFMFVRQSETLWRYNDQTGRFVSDGEARIRERIEQQFGPNYTVGRETEIISRIQARNFVEREAINARQYDKPLLCVGNGVVNLATGDRLDHGPEYKFIRGLEWEYNPDADRSAIIDFFEDITQREADWRTLVDHLAHGLMPGHPYRAFVMTYGPGGNGKTQLGELFRGFVGSDNAAAVELQDLTGDDFSTGDLPGAFVNIGDDVGLSELRDTSTLKTASGGGTLRANTKHVQQFDFKNEAAMFFSANEPPRIAEDKQSINDRLYPIEMPFRFVDDPDPDAQPPQREKTAGIAEVLLNDTEAMQGLLALAVEHAQRLYETGGQYHLPEGPTKRREMYEAAADPILRFALECLDEGDAGDKILKDDAYNAYAAMCNRDNDRAVSEGVFKRNLPQQSVIDFENGRTRQLTPGDDRVRCYKYVRFAEAGRELLSGRLRDRYFPGDTEVDEFDTGGDEEPGDADDEPDEEDQAAFGAKPIRDAAVTRTGYVTVTGKVATTQRLGETDSGLKAVLTDVSGAIDFVSWDPDLNDHVEQLEGECVAVRNAEVSEYDDRQQLTTVDGLTEITSIQSGVGFTEGGPGRESDGAPDEGTQGDLEETTEDNPITQTQGRIMQELPRSGSNVTVSELAGTLGEDPNNVASAVEQLAKKGRVRVNGRTVLLNE